MEQVSVQTPTAKAPPPPNAPSTELGPAYRWSRRDQTLPVTVEGRLPAWLRGQLVRTAPAAFSHAGVPVEHWFDGHGLIYGFELGQGVHFKQQLLATRHMTELERGKNHVMSFATPLRRSFLQRLAEPVPQQTDNANVNVVPWQGGWLALTESPHQHVLDSSTLASKGLYEYDDKLSSMMMMTAHPHYDGATGSLVNVGTTFGAKSELSLFRQHKTSKRRELEARLSFRRPPYMHSFGLTARHAVIIEHPLTTNPLRMLFSDKAYIRHFRWQPEHGTKLWKVDRQTGRATAYETDALFCFHIANTFEDGGDVVFDFLAYGDVSVIDAFYTASLARGISGIAPRLVRARLSPGKRHAQLETLTDARFELPQISYRARHGKPYRFVWGTGFSPQQDPRLARVTVYKVDVTTGEARSYSSEEYVYGEPVFVPRPGPAREDEGVLLAVGSHAQEDRTRLLVLDAETMEPLASCDAPLALPLGFHGNFAFPDD